MIIAVQGTRYGNNEAAKVVASLAVAGVHKDQKRTLILQFMNRTRKNVENYLIGQKLRNESLVQDTSVSDPTVGMDALCANTSFTTYTPELFSEVTRSLVTSNVRNVFDIAVSSQKESFEREILNKNKINGEEEQSFLESILRAADKIYDVVYVLTPSKNEQLASQLVQLAEVNVICLHQGAKEDVVHGGQREYYIVTDYCAGSSYSSKTLGQLYNQKVIFGSMHNVLFNDACIDGLALQFLDKHMDVQKNDANYNFIHNIILLYNTIMRHKDRKQPEADLSVLKKYEGVKVIESVWQPITASVVTKVVTTGIFKKSVTKDTVLVDDTPQDILPADPIVKDDPAELPDLDAQEEIFPSDALLEDDAIEAEPETEIPAPVEETENITPVKPAKKKGFSLFGRKKEKTAPTPAPADVETSPGVIEDTIIPEEIDKAPDDPVEDHPVVSEAYELPAVELPDLSDDTDDVKASTIELAELEEDPTDTGVAEVIKPEKKKTTRKKATTTKAKKTKKPVEETSDDGDDGWQFS